VLGFQFPLRFVLRVLCADFLDTYNLCDARCELRGECWAGDDVFVCALGVGGDETDGCAGVRVQGVWEGDFGGFKGFFVDDVFFGCEVQPDGRGCLVFVGIFEEILLVVGSERSFFFC